MYPGLKTGRVAQPSPVHAAGPGWANGLVYCAQAQQQQAQQPGWQALGGAPMPRNASCPSASMPGVMPGAMPQLSPSVYMSIRQQQEAQQRERQEVLSRTSQDVHGMSLEQLRASSKSVQGLTQPGLGLPQPGLAHGLAPTPEQARQSQPQQPQQQQQQPHGYTLAGGPALQYSAQLPMANLGLPGHQPHQPPMNGWYPVTDGYEQAWMARLANQQQQQQQHCLLQMAPPSYAPDGFYPGLQTGMPGMGAPFDPQGMPGAMGMQPPPMCTAQYFGQVSAMQADAAALEHQMMQHNAAHAQLAQQRLALQQMQQQIQLSMQSPTSTHSANAQQGLPPTHPSLRSAAYAGGQ